MAGQMGDLPDMTKSLTMREEIATPALILDLDRFESNLDRMAAHCSTNNLILRPHAKTHKCSMVAKAQAARGAQGICTAKLGEAEALAANGINDILVTSPQVTDQGSEGGRVGKECCGTGGGGGGGGQT